MDSNQISFVLIGDCNDGYCATAISSIRQWFPGSEIIISTTQQNPNPYFSCDKLIINKDPGELINDKHQGNISLNRLIVNSYEGCKSAKNPIIIRSRTDIKFFSNAILNEYEKYLEFSERLLHSSVLSEKVLIGDLFTSSDLALHPSDWLMMGPADVITEYYNVPLKRYDQISDSEDHLLHRNEQYVFLSNIHKDNEWASVYIKYDTDRSNLEVSQWFLLDNFYISNRKNMGFNSIKHNYSYNTFWNYEQYKDLWTKLKVNNL